METWFAEAVREAEPANRMVLVRHRRAVERLRELDLRDRWGYPLEPLKLARLADFVVLNLDHSALGVRKRESAAIAECVDRLAIEMLTTDNLPLFCPVPDTAPEDEDIQTVVRTVADLKETR